MVNLRGSLGAYYNRLFARRVFFFFEEFKGVLAFRPFPDKQSFVVWNFLRVAFIFQCIPLSMNSGRRRVYLHWQWVMGMIGNFKPFVQL